MNKTILFKLTKQLNINDNVNNIITNNSSIILFLENKKIFKLLNNNYEFNIANIIKEHNLKGFSKIYDVGTINGINYIYKEWVQPLSENTKKEIKNLEQKLNITTNRNWWELIDNCSNEIIQNNKVVHELFEIKSLFPNKRYILDMYVDNFGEKNDSIVLFDY